MERAFAVDTGAKQRRAGVVALPTGSGTGSGLVRPPQSAGMRSGFVRLSPEQDVGLHSTGANEELIVVLTGHGDLVVDGQGVLHLHPLHVAYVPPQTKHDVICRGCEELQYVYAVSPAGPGDGRG